MLVVLVLKVSHKARRRKEYDSVDTWPRSLQRLPPWIWERCWWGPQLVLKAAKGDTRSAVLRGHWKTRFWNPICRPSTYKSNGQNHCVQTPHDVKLTKQCIETLLMVSVVLALVHGQLDFNYDVASGYEMKPFGASWRAQVCELGMTLKWKGWVAIQHK